MKIHLHAFHKNKNCCSRTPEFWSALFDYTKEGPDVSLKEAEETRFWLLGQSNQELLWVSIGADGSFGFAV